MTKDHTIHYLVRAGMIKVMPDGLVRFTGMGLKVVHLWANERGVSSDDVIKCVKIRAVAYGKYPDDSINVDVFYTFYEPDKHVDFCECVTLFRFLSSGLIAEYNKHTQSLVLFVPKELP